MHRLALIGIALLLAGCGWLRDQVKDPEVTFTRATVTSVDFERISLDLELAVRNPNPVGVQLSGYALDLTVGELPCVQAREQQDIDLGGEKTANITVPVSVAWVDVRKATQSLVQGKQVPKDVPWTATGTVTVANPVHPLELPFEAAGELPVVVPPLLVPTDLRVVKADLAKASLEVDVRIENPNARAVAIDQVEWLVEVEGREASRGALREPIRIGARKKDTVTLELRVASTELGLAAFGLLLRRADVDVRVRGTANVDTGVGVTGWGFDTAEAAPAPSQTKESRTRRKVPGSGRTR